MLLLDYERNRANPFCLTEAAEFTSFTARSRNATQSSCLASKSWCKISANCAATNSYTRYSVALCAPTFLLVLQCSVAAIIRDAR